MAGILILNGSPRAPRSNSKRYAALFMNRCKMQCEYQNITRTNHAALCEKMNEVSDVLLVFPLYADGLPVTLLDFLKTLETCPPERKPVISMLINSNITRTISPCAWSSCSAGRMGIGLGRCSRLRAVRPF